MRFSHVVLESIGYELGPNVVSSRALEHRLDALYQLLGLQHGQLEALTGIRERRFWKKGHLPSDGAREAVARALEQSAVPQGRIGALVYAGVCRDNLEPATACAVAAGLGLSGEVVVEDVSNACLGVLSGILRVANMIELGQIEAGIVCSCESAREIADVTIDGLLAEPHMARLRGSLATLTGGSGAVAVVVARDGAVPGHRLLGGVAMAAPEHHALCRWGPDTGFPPSAPMVMETDAPAVLAHGVALGTRTFARFLETLDWTRDSVARVFCHQVTTGHQAQILKALRIPPERDFSTVEHLGNMGTAALPITLAIGAERGLIAPGARVGLLGIGSGLNCIMLGVEW